MAENKRPKDCSLCNLISNNSFKDFVAGERVNNKFNNSYELTLMGILECQWGYQFLDGVFYETCETRWGYGILDGILGI